MRDVPLETYYADLSTLGPGFPVEVALGYYATVTSHEHPLARNPLVRLKSDGHSIASVVEWNEPVGFLATCWRCGDFGAVDPDDPLGLCSGCYDWMTR